jgi:hypothetical protein
VASCFAGFLMYAPALRLVRHPGIAGILDHSVQRRERLAAREAAGAVYSPKKSELASANASTVGTAPALRRGRGWLRRARP